MSISITLKSNHFWGADTMTNGYSNLKPNIALQTGAVFSAAMAASGALPLSSVTLTDLLTGDKWKK